MVTKMVLVPCGSVRGCVTPVWTKKSSFRRCRMSIDQSSNLREHRFNSLSLAHEKIGISNVLGYLRYTRKNDDRNGGFQTFHFCHDFGSADASQQVIGYYQIHFV